MGSPGQRLSVITRFHFPSNDPHNSITANTLNDLQNLATTDSFYAVVANHAWAEKLKPANDRLTCINVVSSTVQPELVITP
jgi:hypothetical protein